MGKNSYFRVSISCANDADDILSQFFHQLDIPECVYEKTWQGLKSAIEGQWWISKSNIEVVHDDISCVSDSDLVNYLWVMENLYGCRLNFTLMFNENDCARIDSLHLYVEIAMLLNDVIEVKDKIWKISCGGDEILFDKACCSPEKYRFVVHIQAVADKAGLFDELSKKLLFPYFGRNWDALNELYCDFHWIDKKEVVIVHDDVSSMKIDDLKTYIEIIKNSLGFWAQDAGHIVKYVFSEKDKPLILRAMNVENE